MVSLLLIYIIAISLTYVYSNDIKLSYNIQHSFDNKWNNRGNLDILLNNNNIGTTISPFKLKEEDIKELNENSYYSVRLISTTDESKIFLSSVPIKLYLASQFNEIFELTLGDNKNINAFALKLGKEINDDYNFNNFNPKVFINNHYVIGHQPEIDSSIIEREIKKNIEAASINKNKSEEPNIMEQSFLLKYWYFILPAIVLFIFGGNGPAEKPAKK